MAIKRGMTKKAKGCEGALIALEEDMTPNERSYERR
jgi:hypothetical protein